MRDHVSSWVKEQWTTKLLDVLESTADQRPVAVWEQHGEHTPVEGSLVWAQRLSGWPEPVIWISAPDVAWVEALNQSFAGVATEIARQLHREVVCNAGLDRVDYPPEIQFSGLQIAYSGRKSDRLLIAFSRTLVEALQTVGVDREEGNEGLSSSDPSGTSRTFDLLLEVGLPVSISFGRTQLPIRDVLKLTTGSIVELNRTVMEPVEVVVNDFVIARGEIVVVEGNYGVRIREIISREERLRTGTGSAQRSQKGATTPERAGL